MGEAGRAVLGKVAKEGRSASQDSQAWRQVRARFVPEGKGRLRRPHNAMQRNAITDGNIDVHEMIICSHQQSMMSHFKRCTQDLGTKKRTLGAHGILDCTTVFPL